MSNFLQYPVKDNMHTIILIGFLFITAFQNLPTGIPAKPLSHANNDIQQAVAQQQPSANSSPTDKDTNNQNKPESIMEASGHFANNQIKEGVVTWIQGGFWNLQINNVTDNDGNNNNDNNNNQTSASNYKANFAANFTMIKPDGSLSHNHTIKNFSSYNVFPTGNDIVVTGTADIHSDNGLEYDQVPLIVHLMGKKVLGLTIDVNKTEGHFSSSNEMFGTLISGIGIDSSNTTKTMMSPEEAAANKTADKMPLAIMQH
jgi:hypothetical protein